MHSSFKSLKISSLLLVLGCVGTAAHGHGLCTEHCETETSYALPGVPTSHASASSASFATYAVDANGLPILNSNLGSMGAAYIDFNGGYWGNAGNLGAYDTDGNASTFNASEQDDIYKAWHDVATHFAMFDINVTTVAPDKTVTPTAHLLVSNDFNGGAANTNVFGGTSPNASGAVSSQYGRTRSTAITHELGHIMGLNHQAEFDENGNYIRAYRLADESNKGFIMGRDSAGKFSSWQLGDRRISDGSGGYVPGPQDDHAIMTNTIITEYNNFSGGTYTGDGLREDDHHHKRHLATTLPGHTLGNPYDVMVEGIIERHSDKDLFKIDWAGGDMNLFVEAERNLAASPEFASSLGMALKLIKPGSDPIDTATDPADTDASLSVSNLAAGRYWIRVTSAGGYDDLGAYNLWVNDSQATAASVQFAAVPEPSSLALLGLGGLMLARRRRGESDRC